MDIFASLKRDHDRVKALMTEIQGCGNEDSAKRQRLFDTMKTELLLHSKAEEKVFYDPLKTDDATRELVVHGQEEHRKAEQMMDELSGDSLQGAAWMQKFESLKHTVEHHIQEEESSIFPAADKVLGQQEEEDMGERMHQQKQQHQDSLRL